MNGAQNTLYIPLYGKAYVSKKGLILSDKKAEAIWAAEGFPLSGKAKSEYLAYYMGMRAAVIDEWTRTQQRLLPDAVVLHIGCGMDSRALRAGMPGRRWYDVDFESVICQRKRYYAESETYRMIGADVRENSWLSAIPEKKCAIVVMEGVSMYMTAAQLSALAAALSAHFEQVLLMMDCYTPFAAKVSKLQNPVHGVGVSTVYGHDDPQMLRSAGFQLVQEHDMTPQTLIDELHGAKKLIFRRLYAGKFSKKLYRLFEFEYNRPGR